ncbi:MAG: Glycerol kinase [Campylobacterota bacterium]|nr:Glycerol kinase [Campylobacterota bacterium]
MSDKQYISTSALSKKLSIPKHQLDEMLLAANFIEREDKGFVLTNVGIQNGGCMKKHPKFGDYIAWNEDIKIPNKLITQGKEFFSSTKIASKYNLSARKINLILSEIGFIERYLKGWTITVLGSKNGGIQKENSKNGIPYVEWDESIFRSSAFLSALKEVSGEAGESTQQEIENTKDSSFREKFVAKHRATDGHMVRSKAEMLIDNWLYMAEIVHAYERKLPIEEEVYCDFYIPTGKVYIEFWGLENDPQYVKRKEIKKEIYKKYDFKLIELTDDDVFNLDDVLPKMLLKFGVQTY